MPCRKENYIYLEQSVTGEPGEVDALVTRIGEALQLHSGGQKTGSRLAGGSGGGKPGGAAAAPVQRRGGCCVRLRSRGRAGPYSVPGARGEQDWDQIRPWNRKRVAAEEDDPHRLLQELILSGNLIKEAVRRLQFSAADCADVSC